MKRYFLSAHMLNCKMHQSTDDSKQDIIVYQKHPKLQTPTAKKRF